jgi:hypothetical protein
VFQQAPEVYLHGLAFFWTAIAYRKSYRQAIPLTQAARCALDAAEDGQDVLLTCREKPAHYAKCTAQIVPLFTREGTRKSFILEMMLKGPTAWKALLTVRNGAQIA